MQGAVPGLVKKLASFLNCVTSAGVSLTTLRNKYIYFFVGRNFHKIWKWKMVTISHISNYHNPLFSPSSIVGGRTPSSAASSSMFCICSFL